MTCPLNKGPIWIKFTVPLILFKQLIHIAMWMYKTPIVYPYYASSQVLCHCVCIWEISQIPRFFGKFPKYPVIWEISKILKIPIGIWEISQMFGYLGNFPNDWVYREFPKCLGFLKIPQISSRLRNFQNFKIYNPQIPIGIWKISSSSA